MDDSISNYFTREVDEKEILDRQAENVSTWSSHDLARIYRNVQIETTLYFQDLLDKPPKTEQQLMAFLERKEEIFLTLLRDLDKVFRTKKQ